MPDFESRRSSSASFVPPPRPTSNLTDADDPDALPARPAQREGLPPGYRMRADPHYVEQLTSRVPLPQLRALPVRHIDGAAPESAPDLEPLVDSIARFGVLQPLLVRPRAGRFELIAGARRLAAASKAGLSDVPCLVYTCDETRARAMAEAENIRRAPAVEPIDPVPGTGSSGPALDELRQSLGTIESCLHLLADREGSLRDRVALDLIRAEAHRAARMVRCLAALGSEVTLTFGPHAPGRIVDTVRESLEPERRLSGVSLTIEIADGTPLVSADPEWLGVGLAGALGGMLAIVQSGRASALRVRIAPAASRASVTIEISQETVALPARTISRFFDAEATDRPGGFDAALGLAAARRVAELHRGAVEAVAGERGCRLVLVLPAVS